MRRLQGRTNVCQFNTPRIVVVPWLIAITHYMKRWQNVTHPWGKPHTVRARWNQVKPPSIKEEKGLIWSPTVRLMVELRWETQQVSFLFYDPFSSCLQHSFHVWCPSHSHDACLGSTPWSFFKVGTILMQSNSWTKGGGTTHFCLFFFFGRALWHVGS